MELNGHEKGKERKKERKKERDFIPSFFPSQRIPITNYTAHSIKTKP
jgi:hypothetical protein